MYEVRGVGVDLCEISRMENIHNKELLLRRCCTEQERNYIASKGGTQAQTMAGIWAAKEAVLKALGTGLALPMADVEIIHDDRGAPSVALHGKAAEAAGPCRIQLSISHDGGLAAAFCAYSTETSA